MGRRALEFSRDSGCLRYRAEEKGINGQSFFLDGDLRTSHFHSDRSRHQENSQRTMALFLEIFCFARSNCIIDSVDHVSVPHQVIYFTDKRRFIFYWLPVIFYAGIIFALSSLSAVPEMPKRSDKILHFLDFFFFAFLLWRAVVRDRPWTLEISRFLTVVLIGSLYAATDELHQSYVPGRYASIYDWFADVAGILGMLTLMVIGLKWRGSGRQRYETT